MAISEIGPLDSETVHFAFDVLLYILKAHCRHLRDNFVASDTAKNIQGCRIGVIHHFDDNIEKIVDEIVIQQNVTVGENFSELKSKSASSFQEYINQYKESILQNGFGARIFLEFCVHVCLMACLFKDNGVGDALDVAIEHMDAAFPDNGDKGKRIWRGMRDLSKKYKDASRIFDPAIYRTGTTDDLQSGTDESSNASSTNTESDSASGSKNTASSAESLHELIMGLNALAEKSANNVKTKESATSASSTKFANIIDVKASDVASAVPLIIVDNLEDTITPACSSTEGADISKKATPSSAKENKDTSAVSSTKHATCESKPCSTDNIPEDVQNPMVSSNTCGLLNLDFVTKIKDEFERQDKSPQSTPVKSPSKSYLGKRPSPRKGISLRGTADDSETEIKKPKLDSPKKGDKD